MNHNNSAPYGQNYHDKEYPTPTPPPARQSVSNTVTLGLGIVAGVMFLSLFFKGFNVAVTVISTTVFYGGILSLLVLIDTGYFNKREEEHTKRVQIRMAYAPRVQVVQPPALPDYSPSVDTPRPALPQVPSFVPPVAEADDSVKREAMMWVFQLYGEDGEPDPKKVLLSSEKEKPGRIRVAAPSRPTKEYLVQHRVLLNLGGTGYRLNLGRCPNRIAAQEYLWRANGVGEWPTPHHLPPTPHALGEV